MKRVLALLAAVGLVVGAIALRNALDDDGGSVPEEPGDGDDGGGGDAGPLVLGCVPELLGVCRQITRADEVVEVAPDDALDRLGELDAWLTFDPWPEVLVFADDGQTMARFAQRRVVVASTGLTIVTRAGSFQGDCATAPDWACTVEQLPGRVAVPSPDTTLGPLLLGWAALDWNAHARDGAPFARAELGLPEFRSWLGSLQLDLDDPLQEALLLQAAGPRAFAATDADVAQRLTGPRAGAYATDAATTGVLTVVVAGPAAERIAGEPTLPSVLEDHGYTPGDATNDGVPNAGVLFALMEVAR